MSLYKKCLILTVDSLVGEGDLILKSSLLKNSLILSKMKDFYKMRKKEKKFVLNTFDVLLALFDKQNIYVILLTEILYILNFKKKFSTKNLYRIISNYFKIVSHSLSTNKNILNISEQIVQDEKYLTTLSLCNLYTMNHFYKNEKKI